MAEGPRKWVKDELAEGPGIRVGGLKALGLEVGWLRASNSHSLRVIPPYIYMGSQSALSNKKEPIGNQPEISYVILMLFCSDIRGEALSRFGKKSRKYL